MATEKDYDTPVVLETSCSNQTGSLCNKLEFKQYHTVLVYCLFVSLTDSKRCLMDSVKRTVILRLRKTFKYEIAKTKAIMCNIAAEAQV